MKKMCIGVISIIFGSLFLLGFLYALYINIPIAIELNDMAFAIGSTFGSGIVGILGFLLLKNGIKKLSVR